MIKIKKKNYQLSVPITIIFNAHWMRQKPFRDNKHTAFNYAIGCNLIKREWKDLHKSLQQKPSLANIWQPLTLYTHQPGCWKEPLLEQSWDGPAGSVGGWRHICWAGGTCVCVTSTTIFAKGSMKSRIKFGSTNESTSMSWWCDLAKPYHAPKINFKWIHTI